ncbi:hypothetical protein BGW42_002892 [Actinomortierella wolfii]|nr:hypothetical protein BGW42_002892 [Actinomortierella wolfii]
MIQNQTNNGVASSGVSSNNDTSRNQTSNSRFKNESKSTDKKTKLKKDPHNTIESNPLLQQQQQQQQQHPLAALSADLHLLFPDPASLDRFFQTIRSLKDDYLRTINAYRSTFNRHLAAAAQREAEAVERARRLRIKDDTEAQENYEAMVWNAHEQLEGLVLDAIKEVLEAPLPPSQQKEHSQIEESCKHSAMADKACEMDHKARDDKKGLLTKDENGRINCEREMPTVHEQGAAIESKKPQQKQYQRQPNHTSARSGWRSMMKYNKHQMPQSETPSTHGQAELQARREALKARLQQLVKSEERKMRERFTPVQAGSLSATKAHS